MKLFAQPPRAQTQESSSTTPTRVNFSKYPNLYLHSNPWINKFAKNKKNPRLSGSRKIKRHHGKFNIDYVVPHSILVLKNCTQAAHHLVANQLFKLPHAFNIYNNQGKKETIDILFMGGDSNAWCKAVVNELVRLNNGVDKRVRATNTIELIRKEEVPKGPTVIYENKFYD